ncbi:alpha/beta-hydrolase [Sistotremastrum suecicum HHB10207 ss-3]|uniref:Alpha/beta-hydrolase n=1 Tax=Sistotremastrum suecicum HHB10207 ss-3 TaxID=1314776 RepID=A0A166CJU5_9AGAM|nr:alpha/beta-hydrolase [Sistotremastrum suecicum HHB10207 ss-3]
MTATNKTLAGPIGNCCIQGFKHEGTPVGQKIHIGGMDTYISYPPNWSSDGPKKIIFAFPDVFGTFYVNNDLVLDHFASLGFLVIAPDYFQGDSVTKYVVSEVGTDVVTKPGFDLNTWVAPHIKFAKQAVPIWIKAVRAEFDAPGTQWATIGYCFGAPFVLDLLAEDDAVVAGAFAHPAFLDEDHFRNIKKPLYMAVPDVDELYPAESRHITEEILTKKGHKYVSQIFGAVRHGFSTKANLAVPYERWVKEECARGFEGWLNQFFAT